MKIWFLVFIFLISISCANADDIQIFDGGDVETMKEAFPSPKDKNLSGLKKMRDDRLAYEAKCLPQPDKRMVSLLFNASFESDLAALEGIDKISVEAMKAFDDTNLKVFKAYPARQSVINRDYQVKSKRPQPHNIFRAFWSQSYIAAYDETAYKPLRKISQKPYINLSIDTIHLCPDGNYIHGDL